MFFGNSKYYSLRVQEVSNTSQLNVRTARLQKYVAMYVEFVFFNNEKLKSQIFMGNLAKFIMFIARPVQMSLRHTT